MSVVLNNHHRSPRHPVFLPKRSTRLRVRPGMVALYLAALALLALLLCGPSQWRWMALGLLPVNLTAIVLHRKPLDPLAAIRRGGWF